MILCSRGLCRSFAAIWGLRRQRRSLIHDLEVHMEVRVGQLAPEFTLPSHLGNEVRLATLRGKNVVIAFFPLAWTPV